MPRGDAISRRHGLRIDQGSLRSFGKHVALLPGRKLAQLAGAIAIALLAVMAPLLALAGVVLIVWMVAKRVTARRLANARGAGRAG